MQIHELTQAPTVVSEGMMQSIASNLGKAAAAVSGAKSAVGGKLGAIKQAYQDPKTQAQIKKVAANVADAWQNYATQYEKTITDPADRQKFANRTDGAYEKALIAFVQQNLLKGVYLPNATNKQDILKTIKEIVRVTGTAVPASSTNPTSSPAANTTAGTRTQNLPTRPFQTPGAAAPNITRTPVMTPESLSEAAVPANVLSLFEKLVQQAALAQQSVNVGSGQTSSSQTTSAQNTSTTAPAALTPTQTMQLLAQFGLSNTGVASLGTTLQQMSGTNQVKNTGNLTVNAVLKALGFQIV